jgi:hypothetical protein
MLNEECRMEDKRRASGHKPRGDWREREILDRVCCPIQPAPLVRASIEPEPEGSGEHSELNKGPVETKFLFNSDCQPQTVL